MLISDTQTSNDINGAFIDLTEDISCSEDEIFDLTEMSQKSSTISSGKTISLNMGCSIYKEPISKIQQKNDINNNQPLCSKYLVKNSTSVNTVKCPLCLKTVNNCDIMKLTECNHKFCRDCLTQTIYTKHDSLTGAVQCPNIEQTCDKTIKECEVKELLGPSGFEALTEQIKFNIEESKESRQGINAMRESLLLPLLLNMDDIPIIPNMEPFECTICFTEIESGQGLVLQNCLHTFCRECLVGCINSTEEFQVPCPFIENDVGCKEMLKESEIRELISAEMFDKHLQKSLKLAEHANGLTFHCRTPDCTNFIELGDELLLNFKCLACCKVNCIKCKAVHEGKNCIEYQEEVNPHLKDERQANENQLSEQEIQRMVNSNEVMLCPQCSIPVQKITGCDFISCITCKLGICWVTKKPRKDLTKPNGTVIKGCGCKEPPSYKKCHPSCGHCH